MDMDIIKRFICGAKEAHKKVDNHSFNFPITIESAYRLATNIEELLKEQEEVKPTHRCWNDRITQLHKINGYAFCPYCGKPVDWGENVLL